MNVFFQHLSDPEYIHVLLNPMPVYGLTIAVIGLALAIAFRNRTAIIVALILVIISGMSAWPVLSYGQAAYDRIKSMSDPAGEQWLDEHMARGEQLIYAFYFLAALAAAGILLPIKWRRSTMPLAIATLVLGGATLAIGGWISYAGGHIRHKEFRFEPPPAARAEGHEHGMEHQEPTTQKPHEMASPMQSPMEHGEHEMQMSPPPEQAQPSPPMTEAEKKQLEASRLQLEASQKQLEASRKQLEAATAKGSPTPGAGGSPSLGPSASPAASSSPSEHKHDHNS